MLSRDQTTTLLKIAGVVIFVHGLFVLAKVIYAAAILDPELEYSWVLLIITLAPFVAINLIAAYLLSNPSALASRLANAGRPGTAQQRSSEYILGTALPLLGIALLVHGLSRVSVIANLIQVYATTTDAFGDKVPQFLASVKVEGLSIATQFALGALFYFQPGTVTRVRSGLRTRRKNKGVFGQYT